MSAAEHAASSPGVRTDPSHGDPSLRGRRYSIPYETVWEGVVASLARIPNCTVSTSDDEAGLIRAEARRRLPKASDDIEIRVGLDADAQTWVSMSSIARGGRFDLGANERRVRAFFEALDHAVGAAPGSILSPQMPTPPGGSPEEADSEPAARDEPPVGADRG